MPHPLVLGLFVDRATAVEAARQIRELGIGRERLSVVARTHAVEGDLAEQAGASPGSEIEDSRPAAWLGELGAHLLAAIALVLPGIGPIVSGGPLAAELGETAGHLAGGIARLLERAGVPAEQAERWQSGVRHGAVLVAVHLPAQGGEGVRELMQRAGASETAAAEWPTDV